MLSKSIISTIKTKSNDGIISILKGINLNLVIKPRFEYSFEALVKALILKEIRQIKSHRALANYLRNRFDEALAAGFDKNEDNAVKTPDRRTFDYFVRNHLDENTRKLIESISKTIRDAVEKFELGVDTNETERIDKKPMARINYQYQKEQKLRELAARVKQLVSPHIRIRTKANAKYKKNEILDVLVHAAIEHAFTNGGAHSYKNLVGKGPASNTILYRLNKENFKEIQEGFTAACDRMLKEALKRKVLKGRKFDVAIDTTFLHFYGKEHPNMVWSKEDRGTNKYFGFITLDIVEGGSRFVVYALPVFSGQKQSDLVKELIDHARKFIRINNLYADRGFANADMFRLLDEENVNYLIPLPDDKGIKTLINTVKPPFVVKDYIRGGYKIPYVVLVGGTKGLMKLATNKKIDRSDISLLNRLPKMYSKRWGIETGYRVKKREGLVRTTSRNYKIRYFYFMFSVLLYNIWILTSLLVALDLNAENIKKCIITFKFLLKNLYGSRPT